MHEGTSLLLIITLFYLIECFFLLPINCIACLSHTGRRWRVAQSNESNFANKIGGVLIKNPFPPLGQIYLSPFLPASFSPTHVCSNLNLSEYYESIKRKNIVLIKYEDIKKINILGKEIQINGGYFVKCGTTNQAILIKDLVTKLIKKDQEQREKELKSFFNTLFDGKAAKTLHENYKKISLPLKYCCNFLFIYIFLIIPALVYFYGSIIIFIALLLIMLLGSITISSVFFFKHLNLYPKLTSDRVKDLIQMVLFPPNALRANDMLSYQLLSIYHPVTVLSILCDKETNTIFFQKLLLGMRYPIHENLEDEGVLQTERWQRINIELSLKAFLKKSKIDIDSFFASPEKIDRNCNSYCPRCLNQYIVMKGFCPDCLEINLLPLRNSNN